MNLDMNLTYEMTGVVHMPECKGCAFVPLICVSIAGVSVFPLQKHHFQTLNCLYADGQTLPRVGLLVVLLVVAGHMLAANSSPITREHPNETPHMNCFSCLWVHVLL
jgi:hypothetical protein